MHISIVGIQSIEKCSSTNPEGVFLSTKRGSTAKKYTRRAITTLNVPTKWKAIRHPDTPSISGMPARMMAQKPPRIPPTHPVACKIPNANPRSCSSVESATKEWMAGNASDSPTPFNALEIAICESALGQKQNPGD